MQSVIPLSGFFSRFLNLRSIKSGIPSKFVDTNTAPVFQRIPPWWARWTWALVACDLFLTGSAIELTWNHWSQLVSDLEKVSVKNNSSNNLSPPDVQQYVPRPAWQRIGLCASHLTLGVGVAVALLVTQARLVRTIAILPPTKPNHHHHHQGRQIFIQCAHNWRNHGVSFPLSRCSLEEGRDDTEMILRVSGERGHWHVGLSDVIVYGKPVSGVENARNAILEEWKEGRRVGKWTAAVKMDDRWKSGPILRQGR